MTTNSLATVCGHENSCPQSPDAARHRRIPNFKDAEQAAARLAALPAWQRAIVVKSVPDKAQLPLRARALEEGKTIRTAVPRLATLKPFFLLGPAILGRAPASREAGVGVAARYPAARHHR